jgi:hypothetical protein
MGKMTKKDYELIAAVIWDYASTSSGERRAGIQMLSVGLADAFERDNPNFNPAMWFAACKGE